MHNPEDVCDPATWIERIWASVRGYDWKVSGKHADHTKRLKSEISSVKLSNHTLPYMIHGLGIPYLATYFILTTKHIIMAVPYGPEDGIRWRLKYKLYDEALDMAKHNVRFDFQIWFLKTSLSIQADLLSKTDLSPKKVGRMIIEGYLTGKRARAAASRLPLICGECKEEWEWAVNQFEEVKLCTLLAEVIFNFLTIEKTAMLE